MKKQYSLLAMVKRKGTSASTGDERFQDRKPFLHPLMPQSISNAVDDSGDGGDGGYGRYEHTGCF